jgi:predicted transcriptional regulator
MTGKVKYPIRTNSDKITDIMADNTSTFMQLTASIVSAYVRHNSVPSAELPALIGQVHTALARVSSGHGEAPVHALRPAVPIKKSITPDYIICLEDGKKFKSLKRHLRTHHNVTPEQYREKWDGKSADPDPPGMANPPPAAAVGVVCGATAAETTGPSVPTVPTMPTVPAVATPTTMATASRCEVWGERRDTDSNGTGKGEESFSKHGCVYSSENRPHGPRIDPAAYVQLNGLIKCV